MSADSGRSTVACCSWEGCTRAATHRGLVAFARAVESEPRCDLHRDEVARPARPLEGIDLMVLGSLGVAAQTARDIAHDIGIPSDNVGAALARLVAQGVAKEIRTSAGRGYALATRPERPVPLPLPVPVRRPSPPPPRPQASQEPPVSDYTAIARRVRQRAIDCIELHGGEVSRRVLRDAMKVSGSHVRSVLDALLVDTIELAPNQDLPTTDRTLFRLQREVRVDVETPAAEPAPDAQPSPVEPPVPVEVEEQPAEPAGLTAALHEADNLLRGACLGGRDLSSLDAPDAIVAMAARAAEQVEGERGHWAHERSAVRSHLVKVLSILREHEVDGGAVTGDIRELASIVHDDAITYRERWTETVKNARDAEERALSQSKANRALGAIRIVSDWRATLLRAAGCDPDHDQRTVERVIQDCATFLRRVHALGPELFVALPESIPLDGEEAARVLDEASQVAVAADCRATQARVVARAARAVLDTLVAGAPEAVTP